MTEVPVIVLDHLSEPNAERSSSPTISWRSTPVGTQEMLRVELQSLEEDGFDLEVVGFSDEEIAEILAAIPRRPKQD